MNTSAILAFGRSSRRRDPDDDSSASCESLRSSKALMFSRFATPRTLAFVIVAGVAVTFRVVPASAQQSSVVRRDSAIANPVASERTDVRAPLLDIPINRSEYRLGAGDVVSLSVVGGINMMHSVIVTPEGTLVVPSMGIVQVLGLDLDQAQQRVRELVFRFYRDVEVILTLSQLRTFKVYVLGAVANPGVRFASSATRVSEVIAVSADPIGEEVSPNLKVPVRRNILLRRHGGDTLRVDLARFLLGGDLTSNPTLREGDELVLPVLDRTVDVIGSVSFPGRYEFRDGETLAEFLRMVNGSGGFPARASDTVRVARYVNTAQRRELTFSRAEALVGRGAQFPLMPFDAIYVSEIGNYMVQRSASVVGQVVRPGTYPIHPETTTVRDLVRMAGGFTGAASLVEARLERFQRIARDPLAGIPSEKLSEGEQQIAEIRAQGARSHVVLDLSKLFSGEGQASDVVLRSGDVLHVPERRDEVVVSGAVARPGILRYQPGEGIDQYVARAGGYVGRADKDVIVLKAVGTRLGRRDVRALDPGDEIVVPFERKPTFLQRWQTASAVISTVSGVVLTIYTLRSLF